MSSIAALQRRVVALRRDYEQKRMGSITIVSDGQTHINSDTGALVDDADIEKLRKRHALVWRLYPKGFLDRV